MPRVARVSKAPARIIHAGETFQFDEDGTRQVTELEETLLSTFQGTNTVTFEDAKKKEKSDAK